MGFFGWMFWLLPLFVVLMVLRRRRGECWGAPSIGDREQEEQQARIESLESRLVQLEERLDFTERLLATRSHAATG